MSRLWEEEREGRGEMEGEGKGGREGGRGGGREGGRERGRKGGRGERGKERGRKRGKEGVGIERKREESKVIGKEGERGTFSITPLSAANMTSNCSNITCSCIGASGLPWTLTSLQKKTNTKGLNSKPTDQSHNLPTCSHNLLPVNFRKNAPKKYEAR